jgi:hypothetical protein
MFLSGLVVLLMPSVPSLLAAGQDAATAAPLVQHPLTSFAGEWVYNADESINIATGRPEQSPRSATQRTPGARAGGTPYGPARAGGAAPGYGQSGTPGESTSDAPGGRPRSSVFAPGEVGATLAMMQESRSLRRDLMEVPEALEIAVGPDVVTFTDDLDRSRSFPVTGTKQKYQLGAARFAATTEWKDSQIQKHIEAADGFRMTETYFLSADGRRMFVIVRLGDPRKGAALVGVNRVYDRADAQ